MFRNKVKEKKVCNKNFAIQNKGLLKQLDIYVHV